MNAIQPIKPLQGVSGPGRIGLGLAILIGISGAIAAEQLPTGGQVVSGQASIESIGNSMTIHQSTEKAILNWSTFNVGRDQSVQFRTPGSSSSTFNRILDANPSQIMGRIQSNGQLIFSNPQGVVFGATAQVDVGGLVVTVHNLSNEDFLAGRWHFHNAATGKRIDNAGRLQAALGGYVALLAPEVRNDGIVLAQEGTVVLASGERISLQFAGSRQLSVIVDAPVMNALVANRHLVRADGGVVILSARSANAILESVIQQSGRSHHSRWRCARCGWGQWSDGRQQRLCRSNRRRGFYHWRQGVDWFR